MSRKWFRSLAVMAILLANCTEPNNISKVKPAFPNYHVLAAANPIPQLNTDNPIRFSLNWVMP
jgi:hypothetical protein